MSPTLVLADSMINTDDVTPGVLGFIVIALVGFVLYFLMKSMLGKLSAVRGKEFGRSEATAHDEDGPAAGEETADSESAGSSASGETSARRGNDSTT